MSAARSSRRWLFCLTDGYGCRGGIAQYNRDLIAHMALIRPDDELHVLQRSGTPVAALPAGVHWHAPASGRIAYALRAAWLMLTLRPRVFCGHLYMAPLIALLAHVLHLRWWLQLHGIEVWQSPSARCLQAARQADLITTVSRHTRRELLARVALVPERVMVLPNTAHAHALPAGILRRPQQLLVVTRLSASERYKGVHLLLAVLPELRIAFPDLTLVVAGEGDDRSWLQAQADALGLTDIVHFAGHVSEARRLQLLAESGVFVLPSSGEGFGIVFVEAAMAGCRVVAGDRDGSVDALGEGALGLLVDPLSPASLQAGLVEALAGRSRQADAVAVATRFSAAAVQSLLKPLCDRLG